MTINAQQKVLWTNDLLSFARRWLTATDGRWIVGLISSAIVFSGQMIAGYAVLDELLLFLFLAALFLSGALSTGPVAGAPELTWLQSIHRIVFMVCVAYLLLQSVRGAFVLGDVRILRFAFLFAALVIVAWKLKLILRSSDERAQVAGIIVWSGIVYFAAYICVGLFVECVMSVNRFDLQGHVWSGTSVALLPGVVILPALLVLLETSRKSDKRLFWVGCAITLFAAFYYQSRLVWLALMLFLLLGLRALGLRRSLIVATSYLLMVILFPWTHPAKLTPMRFVEDIQEKVSSIPQGQPLEDLDRFRAAIFGGAAYELTRLAHRVRSLLPGETTYDDGYMSVQDVDRRLALIAATRYVTSHGLGTLLLGTGYYTHRYLLIAPFRDVSAEYGYEFPVTYDTIVRTATFNGMLVDDGVVGISLLAAVFGLTGVSLLHSARLRRFAPGPCAVSLGSLALVWLSLFIGANYDMVLVYLAVMPSGALLALYAADGHIRSCEASTPQQSRQ
jgi:hypothetical protein